MTRKLAFLIGVSLGALPLAAGVALFVWVKTRG